MHRAFRFFLENRLHVSASALALMWCWSGLLDMPVRGLDYAIILLTVTCICQWNRLTDIREDEVNCPDDLEQALRHQQAIRAFCYIGGPAAALLAILTVPTWPVAALVAAGAAIGFFYNTPLWPSQAARRLKNRFILKNLSSGLGWSLGILVYPAVRAGSPLGRAFWVAFAYTFLTVMTYEMIWDIRDVKGDEAGGVRTLPVVLGIAPTKGVIYVAQATAAAVVLAGLLDHGLQPLWGILLLHAFALTVITAQFGGRLQSSRQLSHALVILSAVLSAGVGITAALLRQHSP